MNLPILLSNFIIKFELSFLLYPFSSITYLLTIIEFGLLHWSNAVCYNSITGEPQVVFNSGVNYLKRPDDTFYAHGDFHARTILDTTIICNRNVKTEMVENTDTFTEGLVGTVRINNILPETREKALT